ncbi:L,D-transpeptidase [Saccharomonospora amisosensis]|uniref:L,D-transpeptidase n=1 Tax=Saccharomonospora amisosensis TaxID=1128677 RepID=UPI00141E5568|nr:Ig-like domain-containing protein [Saccharomonospora amisosensis]
MTGRSGLGPRRGIRLVSALLAAVAVAAGCSAAGDEGADPRQSRSAPTTTVVREPVSLSLSVPDGAKRVEPGKLIIANAEHGKIVRASLVGTHGTKVKADLAEDGRSWTSTEPLGYGKTYTLTVQAEGEDGRSRTEKSTFTTATPARTVAVSINAWDGETVGVGMPLIFDFTGPVPDKAAAEDAIQITTEPRTEGAFHWFGDDRVIWRPKEYWQPGTKVSVDALVYGKRLGAGIFGSEDRTVDITVGDRLVAVADGTSHHMRVFVNGKQVRRMPISMGKPSSSTPNGVYTVMSEHNGYTMDSSTYGVPVDSSAGYRLFVEYAVRLSNSGIFYHSAPWSVGDQGERNVSHGCINLSTENAAWLMSRSKRGDLVRVKRAGGQILEPTDGWSVWQLPWEQWQAGSADR